MLHMNMQTVIGLAGLAVSFALMYPMLLAKLSLSLAAPYAKAESRRRLYAATIDGLLTAQGLPKRGRSHWRGMSR
jgi:hypothetical protein